MQWQQILYTLPLVIAAAVTSVFVVVAWRVRSAPGAKPFALMMLALTIWMVTSAASLSGTDLATKLFWANAMYLGVVTTPTAFLAFVLEYTGQTRWLTRRVVALLAVEPVLTLLLAWTNGWHGLYWKDRWLDVSGPVPGFQFERGAGSWVNLVYTYALVLFAIFLLVQGFLRAPRLYRAQAGAVLLGALGIVAANVIIPNRMLPMSIPVLIPFVTTLTGLAFAFGLFRFRLLDLVPVARATIIEGMDAGVIVLDAQARIVDLNPTAQRIVGSSASAAIGRSAAEVFSQLPDLHKLCGEATSGRTELAIGQGEARRYYDVHGAPLPDRRGQVIVFNEITELKRAQALLFQHQRSLATLEERDRIARELHDSLGQVLGYVNVQAQAIRELLAHGETATADAHLAQLANVAKDAHTDVREYILCVRTAVSPERGFVSALQQYLQRFSQNYGIRTELNGPEALKARGLQPTTEVQLLRIVQEALSNVRKHSSARAVRVNLTVDADQAEVVIEDDGRGFDPVQLAVGDRQHFGVGIMRERAEEIGGTLEVQSAPEQGTRVIVRVPLK